MRGSVIEPVLQIPVCKTKMLDKRGTIELWSLYIYKRLRPPFPGVVFFAIVYTAALQVVTFCDRIASFARKPLDRVLYKFWYFP